MAFPLEAFANSLAGLRQHREKRRAAAPTVTGWIGEEQMAGAKAVEIPPARVLYEDGIAPGSPVGRSLLDIWRALRSEKIDAARALDAEIKRLDEEITFLERHPEADPILKRVAARPEWAKTKANGSAT